MENENALFRGLCENAHDLIQCVSPQGKYLYVNRAWLRTLGYRREEVAGLTFDDIVHADNLDHCRTVFRQLLEGEDAVQIAADFRAKDGHRVSVEGSASCRRENGEIVSTQGMFRDVSDRVQTQHELDRLFELSLDLLCVAGTDGYFKRINPSFERVLGYSREELLSRSFLEFVHPDDREGTLREVENLASGRVVVDFKNRYRGRDGGYRWLAWRSTPLPESGLIYAVARDVTDEKHTQEFLKWQAAELIRSNADLERFAYVASHDLRSPLRTIGNLVDRIEGDLPGDTPRTARRDLTRLAERAARLETLVDDLLSYARARSGSRDVSRVDTAELVLELADLLGPPEDCAIVAEPSLPVLDTDRAALEPVLRNLLDNAVKHHDGGDGRISVSAVGDDSWVEFAVADNGPGISPEDHDRVFKLFQTLDSKGIGMGLALVSRLVDSHGGKIWIDPARKRGLTIRFTWPRSIEGADEPATTMIASEGARTNADDPDR